MEYFYKGFIPTSMKKSIVPFKNVSSKDLLTLEEAKTFQEFAGILNDNSILIDVDDEEQSQILLRIVKEKEVKCRVVKTTRGCHFLFLNSGMVTRNRTHCKAAIGLTMDIKGVGKASYEVLKYNGVEREIIYDTKEYQTIPKWLQPIKCNVELLNLVEGEGRNNALFSYILPLQQNDFTIEECRECIKIINDFVLKESLSDDEVMSILRDGAFEKPLFFTNRGGFLHDQFARYIQKLYNIVKIQETLYIYKDGYYQSGDEIIEGIMVKEIPNLNQNKRKEVLSYLKLTVNRGSIFSDAQLIAFKNGVLDVITGELYEFSPEYIITNIIPYNYNPNAYSKLLEHTINKIACNDESVIKLLYQSIGMCFFRKNELRKSFFLLGEKRNGKSTFLDMVGTLLGEQNISNLDLSEIGDRFKTAELAGKLANIGDDINDEFISNSAIFKKVVSGDRITVERKGKDPFTLASYAKFFFSANSLPRIGRGKDNAAIMDRLVIIPFDAKFSKDDADYDPYIKYKLRNSDVMEALIVKALDGLREVLEDQQFAFCKKVSHHMDEYEKTNNPILGFFEELDEVDYMNESTKDVYWKYSGYCISNNLQPISSIEFTKQIKKQFNLEVKQTTIDKKRVKLFVKR